jgi:ABC-type molybdenum transport system ATPase subunit/photorepair protein PhrA
VVQRGSEGASEPMMLLDEGYAGNDLSGEIQLIQRLDDLKLIERETVR